MVGLENGFVIMKYIVIGTNRKDSKSKQVGLFIQKLYQEQGEKVELIDLGELNWEGLNHGTYGEVHEPGWKKQIENVRNSDGLIMVVPEYNGSYPGALKYFIDYWKYPESFQGRPVCFVGLGGMFGGLRPVEHLQQVFGYRNSFIYPERVFLQNVGKIVDSNEVRDPVCRDLLKKQVQGFQKFCRALRAENLHANS